MGKIDRIELDSFSVFLLQRETEYPIRLIADGDIIQISIEEAKALKDFLNEIEELK